MEKKDNLIRTESWTPRPRVQSPQEEASMPSSDVQSDESVRDAPLSAAQTLAEDAVNNGGAFAEDPDYQGSFGRTLFDDRSSEDGTVTVVFPPERIGDIPSQSLIRIISKPDRHEYIASVTAGPFCEPDGLAAQAPQLVVTAVRGHRTLPRHHGRLQATIIGEKTAKGIIPARLRPRPNSAVHLVPSPDVATILNLHGDARLGLLNGHDDVEIRVDTKKKSILPRHTAHIGTTGGGKSTGVGRTIFELQKANSCVVVFDVEGEYTALNQANDNAEIVEVLEQRGLQPAGVYNTHVYRLCGCAAANPKHPSSKEFTLQFEQISPFAFGEIMDLTDAQNERLIQAYEIAKALLRELAIFPPKGDERQIIDIDEFDRGWPMMRLEDLRYLVSAIIAIAEKTGESEPPFRESQFFGSWEMVTRRIHAYFGAGEGKKEKASITHANSWKALMARISRLQRLRIFDRGTQFAIKYNEMLQPGRVNIIDLSDVENMDVRNLAIAEMLRGILSRQQEIYEDTTRDKTEDVEVNPMMTNVIIEEAHEFLSARRVQKMPTLREQLMKIAKRGRKRYLGLTFVTQSPNDLPDDVLGLVNNWMVYKIDEATIRRLKSYIPNSDESLWTLVRGLGPGQALVSFTHIRRPVIAAIDPSPAKLLMTE
jgi:DNA helicase HerA-like ATPase